MSELHPIFAHVLGSHIRVANAVTPKDSYRGWAITWDYGYFTATSPDYDASYEGEEDGWVDNGQRVQARTREGLYAEVDAWFEEHAPNPHSHAEAKQPALSTGPTPAHPSEGVGPTSIEGQSK